MERTDSRKIGASAGRSAQRSSGRPGTATLLSPCVDGRKAALPREPPTLADTFPPAPAHAPPPSRIACGQESNGGLCAAPTHHPSTVDAIFSARGHPLRNPTAPPPSPLRFTSALILSRIACTLVLACAFPLLVSTALASALSTITGRVLTPATADYVRNVMQQGKPGACAG